MPKIWPDPMGLQRKLKLSFSKGVSIDNSPFPGLFIEQFGSALLMIGLRLNQVKQKPRVH